MLGVLGFPLSIHFNRTLRDIFNANIQLVGSEYLGFTFQNNNPRIMFINILLFCIVLLCVCSHMNIQHDYHIKPV